MGCKGIVEQQCVRHARAVIARKPDFVHAVVEANDAVFRHRLPHIVDNTLRGERETALCCAVRQVGQNLFAQR
jgi:hypothetical protein